MAVNELVIARIDPRVAQIDARHVEDADRLFQHIWDMVPKLDKPEDYRSLPKGSVFALKAGAIAVGRQVLHAPFLFPHARVGSQLYRLKTSVETAERALDLIAEVGDQHNLGWGVNVDANEILYHIIETGEVMRTVTDFKRLGLWRREQRMPRLIRETLGVIR